MVMIVVDYCVCYNVVLVLLVVLFVELIGEYLSDEFRIDCISVRLKGVECFLIKVENVDGIGWCKYVELFF